MKDWQKSFKQMPGLIKFFFILSIYSVLESAVSLVMYKPVNIAVFGSTALIDNPYLWHFYNVSINAFLVWVLLKRSYSLLKKYIFISIALSIFFLANSYYQASNYQSEGESIAQVAIVIASVFVFLISYYLWNQKKYFNKP